MEATISEEGDKVQKITQREKTLEKINTTTFLMLSIKVYIYTRNKRVEEREQKLQPLMGLLDMKKKCYNAKRIF